MDLSERPSELTEGTLAGGLCRSGLVRATGEKDRRAIAIRPGGSAAITSCGNRSQAQQPERANLPFHGVIRLVVRLAWPGAAEPGDARRLAIDEIHRAVQMSAARAQPAEPGDPAPGTHHPVTPRPGPLRQHRTAIPGNMIFPQ